LELRCNLLDGHCWNIEEPLRNNFALGVIEVLCRIADAERLGIGLPKRVPHYVQPIALAELLRFVPLIGG
jgi:hypothetical protein